MVYGYVVEGLGCVCKESQTALWTQALYRWECWVAQIVLALLHSSMLRFQQRS